MSGRAARANSRFFQAAIRSRELLLVVPKGAKPGQMAALKGLISEAREQGVKLIIKPF